MTTMEVMMTMMMVTMMMTMVKRIMMLDMVMVMMADSFTFDKLDEVDGNPPSHTEGRG